MVLRSRHGFDHFLTGFRRSAEIGLAAPDGWPGVQAVCSWVGRLAGRLGGRSIGRVVMRCRSISIAEAQAWSEVSMFCSHSCDRLTLPNRVQPNTSRSFGHTPGDSTANIRVGQRRLCMPPGLPCAAQHEHSGPRTDQTVFPISGSLLGAPFLLHTRTRREVAPTLARSTRCACCTQSGCTVCPNEVHTSAQLNPQIIMPSIVARMTPAGQACIPQVVPLERTCFKRVSGCDSMLIAVQAWRAI